MSPLTREDFELECALARWEEAISREYERYYDDNLRYEYRDYFTPLSEAEAVELAAGAKQRPLCEAEVL